MYLKERNCGHMVEVMSVNDLFDLYHKEIPGRYHYGEEVQELENFCQIQPHIPIR